MFKNKPLERANHANLWGKTQNPASPTSPATVVANPAKREANPAKKEVNPAKKEVNPAKKEVNPPKKKANQAKAKGRQKVTEMAQANLGSLRKPNLNGWLAPWIVWTHP